ncbi:hypothetical protein APUTEX25_002364 [Auxenochlorella protothecoides]|uniref:RRM domain-containing protein n=1 Tax=Auxenochlorella protothecoides TaxID=3075 RepID=A0A1D2A405_AUXPR|nr:hypothetical protein APUTEX25_002364 [Auxenochlorella protothecoides]|eukprot:RMZ57132.1 hypothetical protein APUTEX25_002364 [Auxenochlorella protothecoides]
MAPPKSAAELALERKYEAIRMKKQGGASTGAPDAPQAQPPSNPGRDAALRALQSQQRAAPAAAQPTPARKLARLDGGAGDAAGQRPQPRAAPVPRSYPGVATAGRAAAQAQPPARPLPPSRRVPFFHDGPQGRADHDRHADGQDPPSRNTSDRPGTMDAPAPSGATLFVGDLPMHWTRAHLHEFFEQHAEVVETRVIGVQGYGFVTFARVEDGCSLMEVASSSPLIAPDGTVLRVNWARGAMPEWKKGQGPGGAPVEHPRVREARAAAQEVVSAIDDEALAEANLHAPVPQRPLVCYDDI